MYAPFRALGHISEGAAILCKMGRSDSYVVTNVGRAFQIFDVRERKHSLSHTAHNVVLFID